MMMDAESYAAAFTTPLPPLAAEVLAYTQANHPHSHMLSGHVQGQFLAMISRLMRPRRILEIGTFTGFSALCLAEGLSPDGILHTVELREADAAIARSFFDQSPRGGQIQSHIGEAAAIIPQLRETWDLVFIDADKPGYVGYLESVWPALRQGGLVIADNVLFHGEVLQENPKGKNGRAMAAFNEKVRLMTGAKHVLLTIRDGLMLIEKTG